MKRKLIFIFMVLLFDVFILPSVIRFPYYVKEYGTDAASRFFDELHIVHAAQLVMTDPINRQLWLYFQILLGVFVLLQFWKDIPNRKNRIADGVGGPESAGSGEYGTSRWQSKREMDKTMTKWALGDTKTRGGIIAGVNLSKSYAWTIIEDLHTLIIGSTRSGKTRRWVLPTIWRLAFAGESMILTDPKGELYKKTHRFLKLMGYNVVMLDFRDPGRGNRWNLMDPVNRAVEAGNLSEAVQHASSISHMLVHQTTDSNKGDQIWNNGAESVIQALTLAVAMEAPDEAQKHMTSVYKMLGELGETQRIVIGDHTVDFVPLNDYMKSLPTDHPARDAFIAARLAPERMRGSFYSQVATLLRFFADPGLQYMTGAQDHKLEDIGEKKTAVFLVIPDENTTRHPLAALYVEQAYQALVKVANKHGGRLPVRVNNILDEFGNMPPFKDFATKLTVSGGRGIRWHLIVQDFKQLDERYQGSAETIKGNCHVWIYLLTSSTKTAEEISKKLGNYTIHTDGSSVTDGGSFNKVSHSQNVGKTGRRLLLPEELERFPEKEAIVLRLRHQPARVPLPDLSEWPIGKDFEDFDSEDERKIERVPVYIPYLNHNPDVDDTHEVESESKKENLFGFLEEI
jgi:type IV secretion system protein VirD4